MNKLKEKKARKGRNMFIKALYWEKNATMVIQ